MLLSVIVLAAVAACCANLSHGDVAFAAAEDSDYVYSFQANGRTLKVSNITAQGNYVGVRFGGSDYFGDSEIPVSVEIYSCDALRLDFPINGKALNSEQIATRDELVELLTEIDRYVNYIDALANVSYGEDGETASDVYRYNHAEEYGEQTGDHAYRLEISQDTYEMLAIAQEMYTATDGAFNPAVYRLVDLWGFSSRIYSRGDIGGQPYDRTTTPNGREVTYEVFFGSGSDDGYPLPDEKYIKAFSEAAFTDFSSETGAVVLSESDGKYYVTKNVPCAVVDGESFSQWIDLGGIAKGYVADGIRNMIAAKGADRYYVDIGLSSKSVGKEYDGGKTAMAVQDAFSFLYNLLEVQLDECTVSTSGQYVRQYMVNGISYAHILDGAKGAPAQTGVRAVTVVTPKEGFWAARGDCLTTALTVMGKDGIVDFVNGYLKDNGIKVIVQYESLDGSKQLLTNYSREEVTSLYDKEFDSFAWALKTDENGVYYYDGGAYSSDVDAYKTVTIVLGCILGVAVVALAVYNIVKGRKNTLTKVRQAKKDKPFKICDLIVYAGVVLVILALFGAFVLDTDDAPMQAVTVVDEQTGETLFVCNLARREYTVNVDNSNGWTVSVTQISDGITVRLVREINGEEHFNELTVMYGSAPNVKMTDSKCGVHRDCVRNFPAITRSGGAIVCSPNGLKVVTL